MYPKESASTIVSYPDLNWTSISIVVNICLSLLKMLLTLLVYWNSTPFLVKLVRGVIILEKSLIK